MKQFIEFVSTRHFKEALHHYSKRLGSNSSEMEFEGTVKLHGTNFGICYSYEDDIIYYQSRNKLLELSDRFFNFQSVVIPAEEKLVSIFKSMLGVIVPTDTKYVVLYGELAGNGVQKKVAIAELEQELYIFDMCVVDSANNEKMVSTQDLRRIYPTISNKISYIEDYGTWTININIKDMESIATVQNILSNLTSEVEKQCPVAHRKGVNGIGEGIVWKNYDLGFRFKVKGDEHTNSKVKTLGGVSEEQIAELKNLSKLVDLVCTDARYEQGISKLKENDIEIGTDQAKQFFLKFIVEDTLKEETADINDILVKCSLPNSFSNVKTQLYKNAVKWYMTNYKAYID